MGFLCPDCRVEAVPDQNVCGSVMALVCPECLVTRLVSDRTMLMINTLQQSKQILKP